MAAITWTHILAIAGVSFTLTVVVFIGLVVRDSFQ